MSMGPYKGIVTDNNDPLKACRVKAAIPDLFFDPYQGECISSPWIEATTSAGDGMGMTWVPPVGSAVYVWVEDSSEEGEVWSLMYTGGAAARDKVNSSIPDVAQGKDDESAAAFKGGITDSNGTNFPSYPLPNPGTVLATSADTGGAVGEVSEPTDFQAEVLMPNTSNEGKYPHNRVIKTPGGIVLELDDTPGGERIHVWHPSGAYWEINDKGVLVERSSKKFQETEGESKVTKGVRKEYVGADSLTTIQGSRIEKVGGRDITTAAQVGLQAESGMLLHSKAGMTIRSQGSCTQLFVDGRDLSIGGMDNVTKIGEKSFVYDRAVKTYGSNVHLNFEGVPDLVSFASNPMFTVAGTLTSATEGACATVNLSSQYTPTLISSILGTSHLKINNPNTAATGEGFLIQSQPNVAFTSVGSLIPTSPLTPWNIGGVSGTGMQQVLTDMTTYTTGVNLLVAALGAFAAAVTGGQGAPGTVSVAAGALTTALTSLSPNFIPLPVSLGTTLANGGTSALRSQ